MLKIKTKSKKVNLEVNFRLLFVLLNRIFCCAVAFYLSTFFPTNIFSFVTFAINNVTWSIRCEQMTHQKVPSQSCHNHFSCVKSRKIVKKSILIYFRTKKKLLHVAKQVKFLYVQQKERSQCLWLSFCLSNLKL